MNYINREKTDFFIRKVFDYYNGRINTCNISRLQIDWVNLAGTSNGGLSRNPNVTIIYPLVIGRFVDNEFVFYFVILETIIHELYHQDQMIDYIRMASDPNYVKLIESAVEIETNIYIANHMSEILCNFGLDVSVYSFDLFRLNVYRFECGYRYSRRTWFDHILISLREIVYDFNTFMSIRRDMIDIFEARRNQNRLILYINSAPFYIYDNGVWCNTQALNEFLYNLFYAYTLRTTSVIYTTDDIDSYISVETDLKQRMCF